MEFEHAVRRRRMVRSFTGEPLAPGTVDEICDLARRAPTAGNAAGVEFLVLEGDDAAAYWDVTLPPERRDGFAWPGLLAAPVLVVVWANLGGYLHRYRQPDKSGTGLGAGSCGLAGAVLVRRRRGGGDDHAAGRAGPQPRRRILRNVRSRAGGSPALRACPPTGGVWAPSPSAIPPATTGRAARRAAAVSRSARSSIGPGGKRPSE